MLFNSLSYLIFFPTVFVAYWAAPPKLKRVILLIASYAFYASWRPSYALLLLGLSVVNFGFGIALSRYQNIRKIILGLGVTANLACLCFFKYTNFLLTSFDRFLHAFVPQYKVAPVLLDAKIILPLGISFFAFEFI